MVSVRFVQGQHGVIGIQLVVVTLIVLQNWIGTWQLLRRLCSEVLDREPFKPGEQKFRTECTRSPPFSPSPRKLGGFPNLGHSHVFLRFFHGLSSLGRPKEHGWTRCLAAWTPTFQAGVGVDVRRSVRGTPPMTERIPGIAIPCSSGFQPKWSGGPALLIELAHRVWRS